jgi:hypothetical protein
MVLACLVVRNDFEVLLAAVEAIVIQEDGFLVFARMHQMSVKVKKTILATDFVMSDSVPLSAVLVASVAPLEILEEWKVGIIDGDEMPLG